MISLGITNYQEELKNKIQLDATYYFIVLGLNMFREPLCPSSGAHDDSVCYHIGRLVLELVLDGSLSAGTMDEFPDRRLLPHRSSGSRVAAGWKLSAGRMDEFHPACT